MSTAVDDGGVVDEYLVEKFAVSTRYVQEEDRVSSPSSSSREEESSSCEEAWTDEDDDVVREHYVVCDRYSLSSRRRHESVSCGFDCWKDQQGRRRASSSLDDEDNEYCSSSSTALMRRGRLERESLDRLPVRLAKKNLLVTLQGAEGEPRDSNVIDAVKVLATECRLLWAPSEEHAASVALRHATGSWEALTRADFPGSVGRDGENYTYTLGRMSFGLFSPGDVVVSVDSCVATCRHLDVFERQKVVVPESIDRQQKRSELRSYNIQVRFTVKDERASGLTGTINTYGYCVGSRQRAPDALHRLDVWFVAGDLRPDDFNNDEEKSKWADLFGREAQTAREKRSLVTRATLWFVSVALGIQLEPVQPEGVQRYTVARPITGHVDVLFTDDDLRVTRGNRNSLVIMRRRDNDNNKRVSSSARKQ